MATLQNEYLKLETTGEAGQMMSLTYNGTELLYQGDEGWSGRNPSLFPIVGNTWNGTYEIDGKTFSMKNHGLVRYASLQETQTEDAVTYTLESSEATREQYPFDFKFEMTYRLEGRKVIISYEVTNTGERPMPFTFGLHPAFLLEDKFENYALRFEPAGDCVQVDVTDGTRSPARLDVWQLDREDIRQAGTLVYEQMACDKVVLEHDGKPQLWVAFPGFPMLAVWTHPVDSGFICIEPWYGHADFGKVEMPFEEREGMMLLEAGSVWTAAYEIGVA